MDEIADAKSDENIKAIDPGKIIADWAAGMTLEQIARTNELSVETVSRELKAKQKELVQQHGGGDG